MAELSKIRKNGVDYDIKDAVARKAIEDLEIPEGGTVSPEQIASAVEDYMAKNPIEVVTPEQVEQAVDKYLEAHPVSGLTSTEKNLLLSLLRKAVYTDNMSATIAQLENLWAGGEEPDIPDVPDEPDEPDVPVVTKYTITNELVNVKSSNSTSSVNEGASYTATLTAVEGYEISNVTVTMGGADVTASVYANGVITISSVTGNVEIIASAVVVQVEAVLPEDGLVAFFDLRNIDVDAANTANAVSNNAWGIPHATKGSGSLYAWGSCIKTSDEYGTELSRGVSLGQDGTTTSVDLGTEFTCIGMSSDGYFHSGYGSAGNGWRISPGYVKEDGSTANVPAVMVLEYNEVVSGYKVTTARASGAEFDLFVNTAKMHTFNGEEYDGFEHWNGKPGAGVTPYLNNGKITCIAYYNKALSDVEIAEAVAYMKTLEVTA